MEFVPIWWSIKTVKTEQGLPSPDPMLLAG
jgi:hypothetical protein